MGRKYSFYAQTPFQPHFNHAVGKYVSSQAQFNNELKVLGDKQTTQTGIPHSYVPVEIGDRDAFGATDEGMENFHRSRHDNPFQDDFENA